jgi:phosphoribosylformimino-5-aminoimidazole carboxamide ribonucleotide (ProFAR) isomerase
MIIIPAIDLLGGSCVRLAQGSYASARRYAGDPAEVALGFVRAGARWVHVVDLDAARSGGARTGRRGTAHAGAGATRAWRWAAASALKRTWQSWRRRASTG